MHNYTAFRADGKNNPENKYENSKLHEIAIIKNENNFTKTFENHVSW